MKSIYSIPVSQRRAIALFASLLLVGWIMYLALAERVDAESLPSTGPEQGLMSVNEEIAYLRAGGMSDDDAVIQNLLELKNQLEAMAVQPVVPNPTPGDVIRSDGTPTPPSWDRGEVPCEGSVTLRQAMSKLKIDFDGLTVRCAVVPLADGSALQLWLTDNEWALVFRFTWAASLGEAKYFQAPIPAIKDLSTASIVVVDQELRVGETVLDVAALAVEAHSGS